VESRSANFGPLTLAIAGTITLSSMLSSSSSSNGSAWCRLGGKCCAI
jgi:hypothetical protein